MADADVDMLADYVDIIQVGARNMQNFALLKRLGGLRKPIMLKRGLSSTLKELLLSAEYIASKGNTQIMLGASAAVRTFENLHEEHARLGGDSCVGRVEPLADHRRS